MSQRKKKQKQHRKDMRALLEKEKVGKQSSKPHENQPIEGTSPQ